MHSQAKRKLQCIHLETLMTIYASPLSPRFHVLGP